MLLLLVAWFVASAWLGFVWFGSVLSDLDLIYFDLVRFGLDWYSLVCLGSVSS